MDRKNLVRNTLKSKNGVIYAQVGNGVVNLGYCLDKPITAVCATWHVVKTEEV
jgi:hypothetical protein